MYEIANKRVNAKCSDSLHVAPIFIPLKIVDEAFYLGGMDSVEKVCCLALVSAPPLPNPSYGPVYYQSTDNHHQFSFTYHNVSVHSSKVKL